MSPNILPWFYLLIAGLLEVVWALALKSSHGFSRLTPSLVFGVSALASMYFLALAMKALPIGTAYAIWTGIGAVGTVILGILWLGEPATAWRLGSVALILAGIIGLKLA
ncbi:quaternary ammonium compound-resistance protein SugE [Chitiniphilus shinanonensis]|uniref:Guanidinium exporter n=1 Tax=Chitiniphilus shinanonensis TaxID=553088 RepID=A0ABQ6BP00_9NEIS|nr:quaternary ammonium compound efflux SMR transporter SugE [Chitiniphilus shinanonensis]GLS03359.1 quaternary ammonium compound-resistance protein SugE [Chitiniphilus shinanonensis]